MEILNVNLQDELHRNKVVELMKDYMLDPMGGGKPMPEDLPQRMLEGLEKQPNYVGFLVKLEGSFVGLANCFVNYSTFKAKQLINIHDFVVKPGYRKQGIGESLLGAVSAYAEKHDMCRVTLEVREDNDKAMRLYKRVGFEPCKPNMYFWEQNL